MMHPLFRYRTMGFSFFIEYDLFGINVKNCVLIFSEGLSFRLPDFLQADKQINQNQSAENRKNHTTPPQGRK